jgi:hypothetical protein
MKISRERWVIIRNGTDIFCGLARNYQFKPIDNIGDAAIKTYLSEQKAISAFERSWNKRENDVYTVVKVLETIEDGDSNANT